MDDAKIKNMVASAVEKEIKSKMSDVEKKIKTQIDKDIKTIQDNIKKELQNINQEKLDKEELKKLLKKIFVKQYKFMWEKSNFITSYLNQI